MENKNLYAKNKLELLTPHLENVFYEKFHQAREKFLISDKFLNKVEEIKKSDWEVIKRTEETRDYDLALAEKIIDKFSFLLEEEAFVWSSIFNYNILEIYNKDGRWSFLPSICSRFPSKEIKTKEDFLKHVKEFFEEEITEHAKTKAKNEFNLLNYIPVYLEDEFNAVVGNLSISNTEDLEDNVVKSFDFDEIIFEKKIGEETNHPKLKPSTLGEVYSETRSWF